MNGLRQAPYDKASQQRYFGKYRGRVLDNADPLKQGRVEVEVEAIAKNESLGWALPCLPYAGNGHGFYMIPEVDALVWVEFEAGNLSHPIWVGCFWAADQLPEGAEPGVFMLATAAGNSFKISDKDNRIEIGTAGGALITIEDDSITIDSGGTKIVLDSSAVNVNDGSLEVT